MKSQLWFGVRQTGAIVTALLFVLTFLVPFTLRAQSTCSGSFGNNAVYANCNNGNLGTVGSGSFFDASVAASSQGTDLCTTLFHILTSSNGNPLYPPAGEVIDARGMTGSALKCAPGTSPWKVGNNSVNVPSTILLPAGTIVISIPWQLPAGTHLIGEGDSIVNGTTQFVGTTIQACKTTINGCSFSGGGMISMAGSTGIALENLTLDGASQAINGILNQSALDLSYVDHVSLYRILGTGLVVSGTTNNSGPYTNITFNTGGLANSTTVCAQINGASTKGIHGLTCLATSGTPTAAVLLDGSNNPLEDITVDGFSDGVEVGGNATTSSQSNVVRNIQDPGNYSTMANLVHICGPKLANTGSGSCAITANTVTDLVILGATAPPFNCTPGQGVCLDAAATIKDDVSGNFLSTLAGDNVVSMYVLGKSSTPSNGGYSVLSTSANVPTWVLWSQSGTPTGNCTPGSLLSNINGNASDPALYVCKPIGIMGTWTSIQ
jgi:hypothetical protein